MSAPTHIKYRGQIYKLAYEGYPHAQPPELKASPHERCPVGTHWNEHDKRCKPLPPELAKLARTANNRTGIAKLYSKNPKMWTRSHHEAAVAHDLASAAARKHGFPEVMDNHAHRAEYHRKKATQTVTSAHPDWSYKKKRHAAAPHKKCPKGEHWNDTDHQCKKLPPTLARISTDAHEWTRGLRAEDKHVKDTESWDQQADLHAKASLKHHAASKLAAKHGFGQLAADHRELQSHHVRKQERMWSAYNKAMSGR